MKLQKPTQISWNRFHKLDVEFISKAEKLRDLYQNVLGWKLIFTSHFYCEMNKPCLFSREKDNRRNPKTGKILKQKSLPNGFRVYEGDWRHTINHFSPAGCPNLKPFHSLVECLSKIGEKYYYGVHRVGECPWKKEER